VRISRSIDSYYGRVVESVEENVNGGWIITFAGIPNAKIIHDDAEFGVPEISPGWALIGADEETGDLIFGLQDQSGQVIHRVNVSYNEDQYSIFDPAVAEDAFVPATGEFDPETPPEPEERLAEGPLNPDN